MRLMRVMQMAAPPAPCPIEKTATAANNHQ
jgi:hypothetical protein